MEELSTIIKSFEVHFKEGQIYGNNEIKSFFNDYNIGKNSQNPASFTYNSINDGTSYFLPLFEIKARDKYLYLGPNYEYSGTLYHRKSLKYLGQWESGSLVLSGYLPKRITKEHILSNLEKIMNYSGNIIPQIKSDKPDIYSLNKTSNKNLRHGFSFEQTIKILPENYEQNGFSLIPFIKVALKKSNNHDIVNHTIEYLKGKKIDVHNFTRSHLLEIYTDLNVEMYVKLLLTFWWGGMKHDTSAPIFYEEQNLNRLSQNSISINEEFISLSKSPNHEIFLEDLKNLYIKFEEEGDYKMDGIDIAFFTKIFQFYFEANPSFVLPIIADQWSMKAVLCDMIANNEKWKEIFRPTLLKGNIPAFKQSKKSKFKAYKAFIEYFGQRTVELKNQRLIKSAFELESKIFGWQRDKRNPKNPRYHYENTLENYFTIHERKQNK